MLRRSESESVKYLKDRDNWNVESRPGIYDGDGTIQVKYFAFDGAAQPSRMLLYELPPGASEGAHTHRKGDSEIGSFDEFYYVLAGQGELFFEDEILALEPGDHVYVPNGVQHGVRNCSENEQLKIFLTAIERE